MADPSYRGEPRLPGRRPLPRRRDLPGLVVYRFDAPLFFADADVLRSELKRLMAGGEPPVRQIVLDERVRLYHRVADAVAAYRAEHPHLQSSARPPRPHRRGLLDRLRALPHRR